MSNNRNKSRSYNRIGSVFGHNSTNKRRFTAIKGANGAIGNGADAPTINQNGDDDANVLSGGGTSA